MPLNSYFTTNLMLAACAFVYASFGNKQLALLAELNSTDPLTGALNRRALNDDTLAAISRAERYNSTYLLAFLDLDFFKKVNDEFGHAEGDRVLKQLVSITNSHIRESDKLYRFGGEEFVLIIPEIPPKEQVSFINKLRETIKNELKTPAGNSVTVSCGFGSVGFCESSYSLCCCSVDIFGSGCIGTLSNAPCLSLGVVVTVSFGVAAWVPGTTVASWFKRADDAMYQAKKQGRDCAVFSKD